MITQASQKLSNNMASAKKIKVVVEEGMDSNLEATHEEYLDNALGIKWIEAGGINHMGKCKKLSPTFGQKVELFYLIFMFHHN